MLHAFSDTIVCIRSNPSIEISIPSSAYVCVFIELVFGFLVSFQFFPVVLRRNSKFNVIQFHILSTSNCSNVHIDVLFSSLVFVVCVCKNDSSIEYKNGFCLVMVFGFVKWSTKICYSS